MRFLRWLLLLLAVPAIPVFAAPDDGVRVRVFAGDYDRRDSLVSFRFLPERKAGTWVAETAAGEQLPVQLENAAAMFLLQKLDAGETADFVLKNIGEAAAPTAPRVEVMPEGRQRLRISVNGHPVICYQMEAPPLPRDGMNPLVKRGGFLHPVITPGGNVVSQNYAKVHPHHHGIWTAWTRTRFEGRQVDFWNMHEGQGKVEFRAVDKIWSGPMVGGFAARHHYVDITGEAPRVALVETWRVNVYSVGTDKDGAGYYLFDVSIYQKTMGGVPVELPEYYYGGLGFRGPDSWMGAENTFFLTSEGATDRVKGNSTRARWTRISGLVNGETAGIAILGHPNNFRSPQPVRLHPTEPFFCFAPSQLGDWSITDENPYTAHYRFVVADGEPDVKRIERLWNDFAHPVKVEILD